MIKLKKTFKVAVEIEEGEFYCIFRRKKQNEVLEDARTLAILRKEYDATDDIDQKTDKLREIHRLIGSSLESVEGLAYEDGTPITVEDFKESEVYQDVVLAVQAAMSKQMPGAKTDPEKKS